MEWKLSLKIDLQSPVPIEAGITAILYLQYLGMLVTGYMAGVQSADARSNPSSVITRHQQPAAASSRIQAGTRRRGPGKYAQVATTPTIRSTARVTLCPAQQIFLAEIPKINAWCLHCSCAQNEE